MKGNNDNNSLKDTNNYHSSVAEKIDINEVSAERKTSRDSEIFFYQDKKFSPSAVTGICEEFIRTFTKDKKYHYYDMINDMMARNSITIVVDFNDIFDSQTYYENGNFLYKLVEDNPKLFLKTFKEASLKILAEIHYDYAAEIKEEFKVSIANATTFKKEITDIVNTDVGRLIYTEDFVVSIASQRNYTKSMAWSCGECGRLTYKESIGFRIPKLTQCMYCDSKDVRESYKDAITDTMQEIKLQQKFERIVSGRVPKTIIGVTFGKDMINPVQAGDICAATGIISLQPNPSPAENAVSDYFIEILWIEKKSDDFLVEEDPELEEKVKKFIDPRNEDIGYKNLVESIAPSIMGHEVLKEALLLQAVGSEVAYFQDNSRHRGEINLLLVGDAGTAKSKLARYVYQIYTRAVYVSGKTTEAGITASVIIPKNGIPILEAGAYLLASSDNGGLVVCDEMEKTRKEAREAIAGCLDDNGMVEIHKHTIHQNIQINNASLHIANPKTGEVWDPEKTIKENTGFENWYLSRFIPFIVRDEVDKELDTKKAKHYLSQFGNTRRQYRIKDSSYNDINDLRLKQRMSYGTNKDIKSVNEMAFFNKYVRRYFKPELDPKSKAAKKLEHFYISVRPLQSGGKSARVTIRSLGDLVRLAEASARAHMRNEVTEKDADIAIKIIQASIASSGFNMFKGTYEEQQQREREKEKGGGGGGGPPATGFFSAKELLENKTAREFISQDLEKIAHKRMNRFYREVATKMKKVVRVVKWYGLQKCRECGGNGAIRDGGNVNVCYSCKGPGGFKQDFLMSDIDYQLRNAGLTAVDIQELVTQLVRKRIIHPRFNNSNSYELTKDYKNALLDLAAMETQIGVMTELSTEERPKNKDPEFTDRINRLKNMMNPKIREEVRKELEEEEEDEEEDQ
jgi:replicative DNA helicase Mcm